MFRCRSSPDCGVYMLWHLKHIIELGTVQPENEGHLCFTQDMGGQRLRLAQEIMYEHGL
jgi:hypothetical protein